MAGFSVEARLVGNSELGEAASWLEDEAKELEGVG